MDPSRYKALQAEKAKILEESKKTLDDPNSTPEQIAAATKALNERLPQVESQLEAIEKLHKYEETAQARPAVASGVQVTPASERDPRRGFRDIGDFALAVMAACDTAASARGGIDPRLAALFAAPTDPHEHQGDAGEGYLVPPAMREEIWKLVLSPEGILSFLDPEPTESNAVKFVKDETTPWGAAGVQAKWLDAGEKMTPSKQGTKRGTNELFRLAAFVEATDDLLEDAPRLASRLTAGAAAAIEWKAEEACMFGDGIGKPLGWQTSPALVTVSKESGQAAATLVAKNALKMLSRCLNPQLAKWFIAKSVLPELGTMTIGDQPIWTPPSAGLREAPGGFLLGRPISFSRHCESLGTKGDIQLVDPTGYLLNIRTGGIKYASSIHLFFDYAVTAFRWIFKLGGTPILSAAVQPPKGSNTESHFVTLETRS